MSDTVKINVRTEEEWYAEWLRDHRNAPRHDAARAAYAADHPEGPNWSRAADATRMRYLDAAGYER